MSVGSDPELESLVHRNVETGRYASASEVVREALHLMEERDRVQEMQMASIREQIAAGMVSLRAGRANDGEDFMASIERELANLERQIAERITPPPRRSPPTPPRRPPRSRDRRPS